MAYFLHLELEVELFYRTISDTKILYKNKLTNWRDLLETVRFTLQ